MAASEEANAELKRKLAGCEAKLEGCEAKIEKLTKARDRATLKAQKLEIVQIKLFLERAGLGSFRNAIIDGFGVTTLDELFDPDHLSDKELEEDCKLSREQVEMFRAAASAAADEYESKQAAKRERRRLKQSEKAREARMKAEQEVKAFLEGIGLGQFCDAIVHDFSVATLSELFDESHISDAELEEDCKLSPEQVKVLRAARGRAEAGGVGGEEKSNRL